MNGLRVVGSWAVGPLRQSMERAASSRILGAARSPALISPIHNEFLSDRGHQGLLKVNNSDFQRARFFSHFAAQDKRRSLWSWITAGLFGIGSSILLFDGNGSLKKSLLPTVFCADDCGCIEKKCETSECLRKTDREEELIAKANQELERALKDTKGKAVEYTEAALKAYCDAIEAIKIFMNKVYCAVEEETLISPRFEEIWCDVYEALKKRCELARAAMEKGQCAWELLRRLREVIENGKACKFTQCNPLLVTAEETLICAEKELCEKKKQMDILLKESRVVEQYKNLIEDFRRDLKAEAESLVPTEECKVTLNDNEANMVLTHAYKKILRIQKEMSQGGKC